MDNEERLFTKGANDGYILAHHAPHILQHLGATILDSPGYFAGVSFGRHVFLQERERSELEDLQHLRDKGRAQEREL